MLHKCRSPSGNFANLSFAGLCLIRRDYNREPASFRTVVKDVGSSSFLVGPRGSSSRGCTGGWGPAGQPCECRLPISPAVGSSPSTRTGLSPRHRLDRITPVRLLAASHTTGSGCAGNIHRIGNRFSPAFVFCYGPMLSRERVRRPQGPTSSSGDTPLASGGVLPRGRIALQPSTSRAL